jgi:2-hydroxy-3-keto-5-methylthiopentenyl-1-phosphate phosphatase
MAIEQIDRSDLIIFSDFDGTVSTRDVGNQLFDHFSDGKSQEPVQRWKADQIDSRQCFVEEAALMRDFTEAEFFEHIDSFEIDPGFSEFVAFCDRSNIPLYLLSDG